MDAFRVVPRILVFGYGYLVWNISTWFMLLESPTTTQAVLVSTVVGAAAIVMGLYLNSGRSWGKK